LTALPRLAPWGSSPKDDWHAALADWLAGLFAAAPSVDTMLSYRNGLGARLLEALAHEPGCSGGALSMRGALTRDEPDTALTRRLGMAFTQLFEGAGGPRTVSPFESVHASPSGRLFQASSSAMDRRLRRARTAPGTGLREPSDHLSIELALLARLMRDPASVGEQAGLLDDHLLAWVPGFTRGVETHDPGGFYAGAAVVLLGFLTERRTLLMNRAPAPGRRARFASQDGNL